MKKVVICLSEDETEAIISAAHIGTIDDAIDNIGWDRKKKAAYRRARRKMYSALWNYKRLNEEKHEQ